MGGYACRGDAETIRTSGVFVGEGVGMLQWKPKLIALAAVLALIAAVSGQFTWDSFEQFTWF